VAEGKTTTGWREYVASENGTTRMIRTQDYKYCLYLKTKEESLVDMKNDRGEMRNIAGDPEHKGALAAHRQLLADWSRLSGDREVSTYLRTT
jgi:arylsulfatase A-like enzyme